MKKTKLKDLSCSQLAEILNSKSPDGEHSSIAKLRGRLRGRDIERLKSLGDEPARFWRSKLQIAENFERLPAIQLTVGGGAPEKLPMPRYSAALKKYAASKGVVVHRWGRGAFVIAKK